MKYLQLLRITVQLSFASAILFLPLFAFADSSVYRFYSPVFRTHFYTTSLAERAAIIARDPNWHYEGAFAEAITSTTPSAVALHRFWSETYRSHFYTPSAAEKSIVETTDKNWTYEGIAYWVYPTATVDAKPVYRFWSPAYRSHFYTASSAERDAIIKNDPNWANEGTAYYLPPVTTAGEILSQDFEHLSVGQYTNALFFSDPHWTNTLWNEVANRAEIIEISGDKSLRMTYPAGAVGTSTSGGQALVDLGNLYSELYFRQTVQFESGFDWQRGGKLPGLSSGGSTWSGGNKPTQGEGFSARYMWRDNGRAVLYLYHADQQRSYGDELDLGFNFETGKDYTLTQRIRRNVGNSANGVIEVWLSVDGTPHQKVFARSDLRLGLASGGFIDSLYFSTYFGGNDSSWAPDTTSYAAFDDFIITQSRFSDLP